jgi:pyridoxal phosphate enzyme (YggS family)
MNRPEQIAENLKQVKEKIAQAARNAGRSSDEITLIIVTKTFPLSDLEILYQLGLREFGENRDQEAVAKVDKLPNDIKWHFQGGIQSNKLKSIATWASCIHSVDQLKYAQIISDQNLAMAKPIYIQVSLDEPPESRGGVDPAKLFDLASSIEKLPGISLQGLMAVAPLTNPVSDSFARLQAIHDEFKAVYKNATYLSAGMSGDYEMAISYGATHLRIGSSILGNR